MKNLLTCIALITLCSCGQNSDKIPYRLEQESTSPFGLPKENFYRSVTMESGKYTFENMSINPENKKPVLGDRAFWIDVSEYMNEVEYSFHFYSNSKLETISVFDVTPTTVLSQVAKEKLSSMPLRQLENRSIEPLWGKKSLDKDYDMMNKAYVVKTSSSDSVNGVDYNSETTYLMWFECSSAIQAIKEFYYSCGRNQLKFHYKLLDYKLSETKL